MYHRYVIRVRRYVGLKNDTVIVQREYQSIEISDTQASDVPTAGLVKYR
jgi:hypothetical protein